MKLIETTIMSILIALKTVGAHLEKCRYNYTMVHNCGADRMEILGSVYKNLILFKIV